MQKALKLECPRHNSAHKNNFLLSLMKSITYCRAGDAYERFGKLCTSEDGFGPVEMIRRRIMLQWVYRFTQWKNGPF